jgi:glutamate carboxypeptidase
MMQHLTADAILDLIRSWVEIESPTNEPARVNAVLDLCADQLSAIGGTVDRRPGTDGLGDILLVHIPGEHNGAGVMVLGHVDTVHQVGALAGPLAIRRDGDKVHGPGIYDMKGGNCLALAALLHLAATGRRPLLPVTVMMIPDEEIGSPSSRAQIEAEAAKCKYVLVPEPSGEGGKLTTGRYGIARYHLRTKGRPAHAGANHQDGRSAIREMARQILAVEEMTDYSRKITLNVGNIRGGTHEDVVPVDCEAKVLALVPDVAAEAEVRARLLALQAVDPDVELTVTPGLFRPPFEMTEVNRGLFDHARALANEIGFDVSWRYAGGGSDGNFTGALGIPTLDGLGVVGDGAHTEHEHLLMSCLEPRARLFERLFETLT